MVNGEVFMRVEATHIIREDGDCRRRIGNLRGSPSGSFVNFLLPILATPSI